MGMVAFLIDSVDHLNKLLFSWLLEAPYKYDKNWPNGFRGEVILSWTTDDTQN